MKVLRRRALTLLLSGLLLAACGSSHSRVRNASQHSSQPVAGERRFTAAGMAIHFLYPARFQAVSLSSLQRSAGSNPNGSHAAVGIGPYDLLIVSRYPGLAVPVTPSNVAQVKPQFDTVVSQAVGRRVTGTTGTVNGLAAIFWPRVPLSGLPVTASVRITNVFTGSDEYELQCQATPANLSAIESACREMLSTLTAG